MKRVRVILGWLLAGAVVNVAVAWGYPNVFEPKQLITITYLNPPRSPEKIRRTTNLQHGWPMKSLEDERPWGNGSIRTAYQLGADTELALGILWPGFVVDTLFYATIFGSIVYARFALRRHFRRRDGLCPGCAYDLRGTAHAACPECGTDSAGGAPS